MPQSAMTLISHSLRNNSAKKGAYLVSITANVSTRILCYRLRAPSPVFNEMGKTRSKSRSKSAKIAQTQVQDSPELKVFIKYSKKLHIALNGGVISELAWELHSKELISRVQVEEINHEQSTENARANRLLDNIERTICIEALNFYTILRAFFEYPELKPVADEMKCTINAIISKGYKKYGGKLEC